MFQICGKHFDKVELKLNILSFSIEIPYISLSSINTIKNQKTSIYDVVLPDLEYYYLINHSIMEEKILVYADILFFYNSIKKMIAGNLLVVNPSISSIQLLGEEPKDIENNNIISIDSIHSKKIRKILAKHPTWIRYIRIGD